MYEFKKIKDSLMDMCDEALYDNEEFQKTSKDFLLTEQAFKQLLSKEQLKLYLVIEGKLNYLSTLEKIQMCEIVLHCNNKMVV